MQLTKKSRNEMVCGGPRVAGTMCALAINLHFLSKWKFSRETCK